MTTKTKLIFSNSVLRISFVVVLVGLLVSGGSLIAGHVMVSKIVAVKNEILDLSESSTGKRYRRLIEDFNTTKEERVKLFEVRPSKQEIAYFVQALDVLAARTQVLQAVEVIDQKDVPTEVKYGVPSIRYQLNVTGSLAAVNAYMKDLKQLPYLMRVVSVEVKNAEGKSLAESALGTIIIDIASRE